MSFEIPEQDKSRIVDLAARGYDAAEIHFQVDTPVTQSSIEQFLSSEEGVRRVDTARSVREKQAEVSKDDLIQDLYYAKETVKKQAERLREAEVDDISNDAMSNFLQAVKLLGEFIGELQEAEQDVSHVVAVNELSYDLEVNMLLEYLPGEKKRCLAEELAEDSDVEDFLVVRNES